MPLTLTRRSLDLAGLDVPALLVHRNLRLAAADRAPGRARLRIRPDGGVCAGAGRLAARELRGRVVAVPVLNLPVFRARSPFVVPDDGKNLNRCFPGYRRAAWPSGLLTIPSPR